MEQANLRKCNKCEQSFGLPSVDAEKVHEMTHLLMDQLNKMSFGYGALAMIQLLVSNSPYEKEEFISIMDEAWDQYRTEDS